MIEFFPTDSCQILSLRGTVYFGPCPWSDCVRKEIKGRQVIMEGQVRTVKAIEAYATMAEPRLGTPIGLMFEDIDNG